jgi:hypothetical protein
MHKSTPTSFYFLLSSLYGTVSCENHTVLMKTYIPRNTLGLSIVQLKFEPAPSEIRSNSANLYIEPCILLSVGDGELANYLLHYSVEIVMFEPLVCVVFFSSVCTVYTVTSIRQKGCEVSRVRVDSSMIPVKNRWKI